MITRTKIVWGIRWRDSSAKWREKTFGSETEARAFVERTKKFGYDYQLIRAWRPTLLGRVLNARLVLPWLQFPIWPFALGLSAWAIWRHL